MQNTIQIVEVWKVLFNVDYYGLPEHLHKAYDVVLPASLGDKDGFTPRALRSKLPSLKWHLYYLFIYTENPYCINTVIA